MTHMYQTSLLALALAFAAPAFAGPPGPRGGGDCEKLKLSPEQEKNIRAEHLAFEDKAIDLEAAVEHARLNFDKVVSDEKSDAKAIENASERVSDAIAKKIAAEQELRASIFAKDLKPNQRAEALRCFGHEMHEGHPHFGPHMGPHPGFQPPHFEKSDKEGPRDRGEE